MLPTRGERVIRVLPRKPWKPSIWGEHDGPNGEILAACIVSENCSSGRPGTTPAEGQTLRERCPVHLGPFPGAHGTAPELSTVDMPSAAGMAKQRKGTLKVYSQQSQWQREPPATLEWWHLVASPANMLSLSRDPGIMFKHNRSGEATSFPVCSPTAGTDLRSQHLAWL